MVSGGFGWFRVVSGVCCFSSYGSVRNWNIIIPLQKHAGSKLVTILLTVISIVFQSIYIIDRLLTVLLYCNIIIEGSIYEVPDNSNVLHIV